jgi:uncharacterized protein
MPRPIHFEIHAEDPQKAIKFYTGLFGWTFNKWQGPQDYWLIKTGEAGTPGIDGGLTPRRGPRPGPTQPPNAFVCTVDVPNVDATMLKVGELGGKMVVPKMPVPTVGWLAFAHDPESNVFGMLQMDANAK